MFWQGFFKQAEAGTASGFTGVGKGNLPTGNAEQGQLQGTLDTKDTLVDKTLLDRQRNPKDFCIGNYGEDGPADSNQHIIY